MDNNQEPVTQTEEKIEESVDTQATENKDEGKTFTQADFNKFSMKLENKYKEKYKDYDKWLESQKTETEKQNELNQKMADTTNENKALKQENLVLKSNVDAEFVDYVQFAVSKMEGDFEDNLKEFLKDNPKYLQAKQVEASKNTGAPVQNISENANSGVRAILKAKHPDLKI